MADDNLSARQREWARALGSFQSRMNPTNLERTHQAPLAGASSSAGVNPSSRSRRSSSVADLPDYNQREPERLKIWGKTFVQALNGALYAAALQNPELVLDIGTGTGIWALDFAATHKDSQVLAFDINYLRPSRLAPNCEFMVKDAEKEWGLEKGAFDFIHARYLVPAIARWSRLWRQSYDHLKSGGWVEHQEDSGMLWSDDPGFKSSRINEFANLLADAADEGGRSLTVAAEQKDKMEAAGFVNVVQKVCKVPVGTWDQANAAVGT